MRNRTIFIAITSVLMLLNSITAFAQEDNSVNIEYVDEVVESPLLIAYEEVSVKERIQVGEVSVALYCTFDDPEDALSHISENRVVQLIKDAYDYAELSDTTWKQYYDAMCDMLDASDCPAWYNERDLDFRQLRQFFDIYENEEKNIAIITLLGENAAEIGNEDDVSVLELLPYDSCVALKQQSLVANKALMRGSAGFDVTKGNEYAIKYAESPNKTDYDYFIRGDCTNFASQILENGGIVQDVYDSESSGWWHKKTLLSHKQSISWINANTVAEYMGVGYTTTSHSSFAQNITAGDFIGADYGNDGDWNHIGYVTEKSTNGYDYKVAQHTSNYFEWTSSRKNGWNTVGTDGGAYGRIRR